MSESGLTKDDVLALPPSVDLPTACKALGIGKATGYRLVAAGDFPCPVVRLGKAIRVPAAGIHRVLGLDTATGA